MKLSDIKGERAIDVIADLIDPILSIAEDKEASAMFVREKLPEGMTVSEFVMLRIRKSIPTLLRNHKSEIVTILSTIEGVPYDEYTSSLTMEKLILDIANLLTDDVFSTFFISSQSKGK